MHRVRVSAAAADKVRRAAERGEVWALTSSGSAELSVDEDGSIVETVGKRNEDEEFAAEEGGSGNRALGIKLALTLAYFINLFTEET